MKYIRAVILRNTTHVAVGVFVRNDLQLLQWKQTFKDRCMVVATLLQLQRWFWVFGVCCAGKAYVLTADT